MERAYLIRYGLMGQVGRFSADAGDPYERGQTVVVRSHRGTELGEVLIEAPQRSAAEVPPLATARILRAAAAADVETAGRLGRERATLFEACQRVFRDGVWPIDLIDVEPLLDDRRAVLHYLGPHNLDVAGLLASFRSSYDLDVMLEPVGRDLPDEDIAEDDPEHSCGSCGSDAGGCGTGGGCGTSAGGCGDCGVKKLLDARR